MMKENRLRNILDSGKTSIATRVLSTWPGIVEAVGSTGNYDYIEFVAEYVPFTEADMENIVRAAELHNMGSIIKVDFQGRFQVSQRAVGAGFQGVLFADHKTADEVYESIKMIRPSTPQDGGFIGRANRRFRGYIPYISQMDFAEVVRQTVVIIMIEKKQAMDNIEEICSVPGVDMVQFGPSDYSMSCGVNANDYVEEYKAAERRMIEVALKHGVQPRCEIATPKDAQYYIDLGVKHFCLGDELKNNLNFWNINGKELKAMTR